MAEPLKVKELQQKVVELMEKALGEIRRERAQTAETKEGRFRTAEYLLIEAREYVDGAFILLEAEKPRASLAVSRWVLEAALNLLWSAAEPDEVADRLCLLVAEALRLEALRLKGLAELYPGDANRLLAEADARQKQRVKLVGEKEPRLAPLEARLRSAIRPGQAVSHEQLYALYRICCAAAHPNLEMWRRFGSGPGGATVTSAPPDSTHIAIRMVVASSFHLVSSTYCLTHLGDADSLKKWWDKEISPLLGCE